MTSSTGWASRPVPTALSVEKLASWVDRSLDRHVGLLFTATPREELAEIGRFQRLKDQAWVGQVRAIVAAYNRASASEREFAGDEVALAVGAAPGTGCALVGTALQGASLPGLLEAVEAGMLTERHVHVVLRELHLVQLSLEQRQAIVLVLLARYDGQAPAELGRLVRRLILTVDRAAALTREQQATKDRRVRFYPDGDGQGVLHARGPLARIAAIRAALERGLAQDSDERAHNEADGRSRDEQGDGRCRDEREFDLLVALLTGTVDSRGGHAHVVVPFSTAAGGDLELAEIPGFGPILPSTARELLEHCQDLTQVAVDPDGTVIAVSDPVPVERPAPVHDPVAAALKLMAQAPVLRSLGVAGYRVPQRVQRYLEARDRTCVFPGCHRPAQQTDKDHRIPWPTGPTDPDNLQCLCRRHHRAKQTLFTVELTDQQHYLWTTRGG